MALKHFPVFKDCLLDGKDCPSSWTKWEPRKGCRQLESQRCGLNGQNGLKNGFYTTQSRKCEQLGKMGKTIVHKCLGGHLITTLSR